MRTLLRAALAAAVSLSVLLTAAPAPAGARAPIATTIVVAQIADAPTDVAGRPLSLSGALVTDPGGGAVPGRLVTLRVRPAGADSFRSVGSAVTDAQGVFEIEYVPTFSFRYRFRFAGDEQYGASASQAISTPVGPHVSIKVKDATIPRGGRLVVRGVTTPKRSGRTVRLYRGRTCRGGFCPDFPVTLLAKGEVRADGTYRLVARPRWDGKRRVFVEVAGGGRNATGWSRYRWVTTQ